VIKRFLTRQKISDIPKIDVERLDVQFEDFKSEFEYFERKRGE
jgi:hypothetical protein